MARASIGAVVVGAAVAACFSTPTRPQDGTGDSGVDRDGSLIDGLPLDAMLNVDGNPNNCMTETFVGSGSGSCGTTMWANYQTNSGMAYLTGTSAGELKLNMFGGSNSFVNCTSGPAGWSRVTIDVQDVATTGPTNHTFLGLQSMDGQSHWGLDFAESGGSSAFTPLCDGGGVAVSPSIWNPLKHRYIKIERTPSTQITISTSDDNLGFTSVTECTPAADLSTLQAQLRVYTASAGSNGTATSDIATFGFIELCED